MSVLRAASSTRLLVPTHLSLIALLHSHFVQYHTACFLRGRNLANVVCDVAVVTEPGLPHCHRAKVQGAGSPV
ncbi:unnamed protein product, partial [Mycena citricolor]